jgi:RHS repeat-associated protein
VVRFQLGNHLGSSILEVDAGGSVISYEEYHPYGTTAYHSGTGTAEVSLKRYRYTGKERDEETGLYYHGARYYAPWLGRWTAVDPAGIGAGASSYAYANGNPVIFVDPDGMDPKEIPIPNDATAEYHDPDYPQVASGFSDKAGNRWVWSEDQGRFIQMVWAAPPSSGKEGPTLRPPTIKEHLAAGRDAAHKPILDPSLALTPEERKQRSWAESYLAAHPESSFHRFDLERRIMDFAYQNIPMLFGGKGKGGLSIEVVGDGAPPAVSPTEPLPTEPPSPHQTPAAVAQESASATGAGTQDAVPSGLRTPQQASMSPLDASRIQAVADKTGARVTVVGSRAGGTAKPWSDWDYIVEGNAKARSYARWKLPKGVSGGEYDSRGVGKGLDFFDDPLDPRRPHVVFVPKK